MDRIDKRIMRNLSYKIITLGCKVNQYDSGALSSELLKIGFRKSDTNVNLLVVNTCAVTKVAIRKAEKIISKEKLKNPDAKIYIIGCWPKVYKEDIREDNYDLVCGVNEVEQILNKTKELFLIKKQRANRIVLSDTQRARYTIKVQDGCEQFCSYCIIPYTRGKLKSRKKKEILDEVKKALEKKYHEIVISGIHLGLYGIDLNDNYYLVDLLRDVVKIPGEFRIRISSIEVSEVGDDLIGLIAKSDKICKHLHIPLQSGSDNILKSMNRPYNLKSYKTRLDKIKKYIPDIAITTDVIVGFPGERDTDFLNTVDFVKKVPFSKLHVFPFSAHEKTPAAKMEGVVSSDNTKKRAKKLRSLGDSLSKDFETKFYNKKIDVVVERVETNFYVGKSEYYFDTKVVSEDEVRRGEFKKIKFIR